MRAANDEQRGVKRAPKPQIALGAVFANEQAAVASVQHFARVVQKRRVWIQSRSAAIGASSSNSSSSNLRSATATATATSSSQRASSRSNATLTLRNQVESPSSSAMTLTFECENGPVGCEWRVGLERVDASPSSSSSSPWRVSFLDLNHHLQHCTDRKPSRLNRNNSPKAASSSSMNNDDAELRLHQLFAPAPISDDPHSVNFATETTPTAFYQQQQAQIGAPHRYFPSSAAAVDSSTAALDSFELEKYAINHVASTFAPSPVGLSVPPAMMFDMAGAAGFSHQPQHLVQHQLWDVNSLHSHHQLQHQLQYRDLGSGHSTPSAAESARVQSVPTMASSSHRVASESAAGLSSVSPAQPSPASTMAILSSASPGSRSALADKKSVTLNTKMRWISAKEASKAVNDYALFVQKKRARMDKKTSGGRNKKYICSCTHCGWFVRLIKVTKSDNWKISSMQLTHSDNCTGEAQPSARQLAELNTLRNRVVRANSDSESAQGDESQAHGGVLGRGRSDRLVGQTDFSAEGESLGVKIPVRLAYRAKKILQENSSNSTFSIEAIVKGVSGLPGHDLQEKIAESYKLLPSLLQKYSDLNPGSAVCLKKDEKGRFKSAFVLPAPLSELLPSLQSAFGLEIVPCGRSPRAARAAASEPQYNGHFVVLLGKDGNLEHRVVAFGLIPAPDTENVAWFLRSLQNAGFQMCDVPVVLAYHQLGALAALRREFPRVLPMFCVESFIQTIEQRLSGGGNGSGNGGVSHLNLDFITHQIRLASLAETPEAFRTCIGVVAQHFPSVASFLLSFDASLWALHASRSVKKYHWISTGFREYMSADVQLVIKSKRSGAQRASRGVRGQSSQLEASSGDDVQRVRSIQLADFDTMVPLEIIYQFLLHYLQIESRRAVDIANLPEAAAPTIHSVRLTPGAEELFHRELFESEHVEVCASEDPSIALVLSKYAAGDVGCRVHMDEARCSCAWRYQLGIPCRHLLATARALKRETTVLTECDQMYTLAVHRQGVQRQSALEDRIPALGELNRDSSIYPAPVYGSSADVLEDAAAAGLAQAAPLSSGGKRRARDDGGVPRASAAARAAVKRTHTQTVRSGARGSGVENDAAAGNSNSSGGRRAGGGSSFSFDERIV